MEVPCVSALLRPRKDHKNSASARISKGQGAVLAKKGQFASYKEKLEKRTEFHSF
jgi:hypothetical protein